MNHLRDFYGYKQFQHFEQQVRRKSWQMKHPTEDDSRIKSNDRKYNLCLFLYVTATCWYNSCVTPRPYHD